MGAEITFENAIPRLPRNLQQFVQDNDIVSIDTDFYLHKRLIEHPECLNMAIITEASFNDMFPNDEDDEDEIDIGSNVGVEHDGDEFKGTIIEFDDDEDEVLVRRDDDDEEVWVPFDSLFLE